jgi:hypothetical protein
MKGETPAKREDCAKQLTIAVSFAIKEVNTPSHPLFFLFLKRLFFGDNHGFLRFFFATILSAPVQGHFPTFLRF